jgi:hypothetical protein
MLKICPLQDIHEISPAARQAVAKVLREQADKLDPKG